MRRGISLIEVLISMFVLMIGLMGVAAMFPVGSYYMVKAEQLDRGTAVAQAASEELRSRGLLAPSTWRTTAGAPLLAMPTPLVAVVIDPLGVAHGIEQGQAAKLAVFPRDDQTPAAGTRPVRVTVPDGVSQIMSRAVANMIFTSRDDLSFALPTRGDAPANLLFDDVLGSDPPLPLRRQWLGEYSWLATIGPQYDALGNLVTGRDPRLAHQVSVVVVHKRNPTFPTGTETELSEREVGVRILSTGLGGGEVRLEAEEPRELNGMRQGEWIMLFGPHPVGAPAIQQRWFLAWYRIVSMDLGFEESPTDVNARTRIVSLKGPRWPWNPNQGCRAGLVSGAIAVRTMSMRLESRSPWSIPELNDVGMPGGPTTAAR